jgi:Protein of unknown function (DUF551)
VWERVIVMGEWQPIETAAMDETAVWILCEGVPYIGYGEPANALFERPARWTAKAGFRRRDDGADEIFATNFRAEPTHWQPLPEAP